MVTASKVVVMVVASRVAMEASKEAMEAASQIREQARAWVEATSSDRHLETLGEEGVVEVAHRTTTPTADKGKKKTTFVTSLSLYASELVDSDCSVKEKDIQTLCVFMDHF